MILYHLGCDTGPPKRVERKKYPIAGWLFQACIVLPVRGGGATSGQYCISRAPGGYSKPILYYPFAGRLLQASIVSCIARWLFQASRVRVKMKVKADRSSRKITRVEGLKKYV